VIKIRKVDLRMNENFKYEIIKKLVDTDGNKKNAALKLGCTVRNVNRLINLYKTLGKEGFIHGNRGRKPAHTIPSNIKQTILDLYRNKYYDANFEHFCELLSRFENITISPSTVRSVLMQEFILSPKANRATKKKIKKLLSQQKKKSSSKKEIAKISDAILSIDDAHPRRPRCAFFGEMIQMDASVHNWFGNNKTQLHIAVDDSTGCIVGAYFDHQETLNGYYHVFHQILTNYGIPYMFFTDRRTVFEYKKKNTPSVDKDTFTQFSYACNQLGVEIKTSSVPQAKGRVERIFQTLQSRLHLELRLAGITTNEQANIFLNSYIKEYNAKFALPIDNIKSVFEKQPDTEKINLILSVIEERKVDNGHCIRFNNKYFKLIDCKGHPVYYHKVIRAFDKSLYACVNERVYALEEVPKHEYTSRNFVFNEPIKKTKKKYIPPMNHPWRKSTFLKFVNKQSHRHVEIV
jgi:hypothetical protein